MGGGRHRDGFGEQIAGECGVPGPVWHISVGARTRALAWFLAVMELKGYGDRSLGEWRDTPGGIVHLRRRLSAAEAEIVGPLRDIRGTNDERSRLQALFRDAPHLRTLLG